MAVNSASTASRAWAEEQDSLYASHQNTRKEFRIPSRVDLARSSLPTAGETNPPP